MSLDTIIHASLSRPARPVTALVLMGGGARTAYQVGVLRALASILKSKPQTARFFPFQVLVGTSAGAINAACLAGYATNGLQAFERLAQFWGDLRSSGVYQLNVSPWARFNKFIAAWSLSRHARANGAILDNLPLRNTLQRAVSLPGVEEALRTHTIEALAVTASSYTSGVHWTFCHTAPDSAFPFLFPSTRLAVDRHQEYFGDGSMRQISPLSPALHLGAQKVFAVGVGQPERAGFARHTADAPVREPALGNIAGHAMASVFHDTLRADVEQTHRVTQTLRQLPREAASALPFRHVDVLAIQPTQSLDALAQEHVRELPAPTRNALGGLGILKGGGGTLASYLLFEPGFVQALIAMGENDAYARKAEVLAFFSGA